MFLQQYFVSWVQKNKQPSQIMFFGSFDKEGTCVKQIGSEVIHVIELQSMHEEADDRMVLHLLHGNYYNIKSILIYSTDTGILVSVMHHNKINLNLDELYILMGGSRKTGKLLAIHLLSSKLDPYPSTLFTSNPCP